MIMNRNFYEQKRLNEMNDINSMKANIIYSTQMSVKNIVMCVEMTKK